MKKTSLLLAIAFCFCMTNKTMAYNFSAINNGQTIYYNITSSTAPLTVEVTSDNYNYGASYRDTVDIPSTVTYNNNTYSVTSIGEEAFYDCIDLISVTIPNSVIYIEDGAFSACWNLTSLIIPNSVISIGFFSFLGCSGLTSLTIPNSVTSIRDGAFAGCRNLTSLTISNSVTTIGDFVFSACSNLTSVIIPNSVISIGDNAFSDCSSLTSITIGSAVRTIGAGAFSACSSLTSVIIPDSVISIGDNAFSACSSLTSITIGSAVRTIGADAFTDCSEVKVMYVYAVQPPSIVWEEGWGGTFTRVPTVPVHVPCGTKDVYKTTAGWRRFDIIDAPLYYVTVGSNDSVMGTAAITQANTCTNDTAIITATANQGYRFIKWNDGNTQNPRTITVTQNVTYTAEFALETAITNISASQSPVVVYPNPAKDNIHITLPKNIHQGFFTLYDMQGKVLIRKEISNQEIISVNNLAKGIYIYNVTTNKEKYTGKLIIVMGYGL